jgi:hypothetical protein
MELLPPAGAILDVAVSQVVVRGPTKSETKEVAIDRSNTRGDVIQAAFDNGLLIAVTLR